MTHQTPEKISVNEQFLKDFIARGGKAESATGTPVDQENLDKFLEQVAGPDTSTPKQEALHKEAMAQGAADTAREDEKAAQKERAAAEKLAAKDAARRQSQLAKGTGQATKALNDKVVSPIIEKSGALVDTVSNASTAGGVGLLLVVLVFLLFVIVQVNAAGDTRLKQFWYMLNGRAKLVGRMDLEKQGETAAHAGGPAMSGDITTIDSMLMSEYRSYTA